MSRRRKPTLEGGLAQESGLNQQLLLPEADLEVIDALQIAPRASWTDLGAPTESSPATPAER